MKEIKCGDVRVVEDAAATVRGLRKDRDAQWVAGLRPEDEFNEIEQQRARVRAAAQRHAGAASEAANAHEGVALDSWWLRFPLMVGVVWILVMVYRLTSENQVTVLEMEYPPYEFREWQILRGALSTDSSNGAGTTQLLLESVGPTTVAAIFTLLLSYRFAVVTQDFLCFCSFGSSAMIFCACISTATIVLIGCSTPDPAVECSTPLVSMWVSSLMRWVLPWVSLYSMAAVWDGLASRASSAHGQRSAVFSLCRRIVWRTVVSLPLLFYAGTIGISWWVCYRTDTTLCGDIQPLELGSSLESLRHFGLVIAAFKATEWLGLGVAVLVWLRCWMQKPLGLVPFVPSYQALPPARFSDRKEKKE